MGVMHAQVIDDEEDLVRGILNQRLQKLDETLGVDRAFHDPEGYFAVRRKGRIRINNRANLCHNSIRPNNVLIKNSFYLNIFQGRHPGRP